MSHGSTDTQARRTAIQHEVTAVAVRYESDTAPETPGERFADIAALGDHLTTWVFDGDPADPAVLLELAGRCQAWLEHIATTEAL